tara:strand:- start:1177 stop:1482 length:306 start_codon:yes stop_codon:yes gene_type:complete
MKNKSVLSTTCQKFMNLFKGIDFNIFAVPPKKASAELLSGSISHLDKMLADAKKELASAKKSYHSGHITRDELFDFDWRVFEIKEEIRKIKEDLMDDDELI